MEGKIFPHLGGGGQGCTHKKKALTKKRSTQKKGVDKKKVNTKKSSPQKKTHHKKNSSLDTPRMNRSNTTQIPRSRLVALNTTDGDDYKLRRLETQRIEETANKAAAEDDEFSVQQYGTMEISDVCTTDEEDTYETWKVPIDDEDGYHTPVVTKKNAGKKNAHVDVKKFDLTGDFDSDDDYMMKQHVAIKKKAGAGKANLPKVSSDQELELALDWEFDDLPALEPPVVVATNTSTTRSQGQGPKVTRWTATYNNPTYNTIREFAENMISSGKIKGFVGQEEVGANGTPHYQFYTEFKAQTHMTGVKKAAGVNSLHLEKSKGSKKQNIAYCTKEDTRAEGTEPFLWGTCADERAGQGARNDIDAFARAVVEHGGVNMNVMEEFPGHALRYGRHGNDLMAARHRVEQEEAERAFWVEEARRQEAGEEMRGQQQRHVELYFGPTAVGKTSAIKTKVIGVEGKHLYNKAGGNRWYCGYNGQEAVLIDEFKGDSYGPVEEFNNVTNMGTTNVETKGGHAMLTATDIYVASNRHPSHWWKKGQDTYLDWTDGRYRAVARRFAKVTWWNDAKEKVVLVNPGPQEDTEEWTERNTQWVAFWEWKTRLAVAGDSFTSDENLYFTL
uniref:Replication-associated protein n=1 Tax=Cressdnaviricota sp. TaxID=2748378 RepID=A0A6M3YNX3_9VIRU|nr:MAG: replication-associated protein [Cressdnaviricota sp.]